MNTSSYSPSEIALSLTHRGIHRYFKMAAVIMDNKDNVFAWGWNHYTVHAECHAIKRANKKRLSGSTILVVGVNRGGNIILSKPCPKCMPIIEKYKIRKVIYATPNGFNEIFI